MSANPTPRLPTTLRVGTGTIPMFAPRTSASGYAVTTKDASQNAMVTDRSR